MAHPLRSGTSLISADMYLPACSHTCVRAKHGRSDSSSRPRSRRAVPAPILTAAAAFDSFVSTNTWTDRRLPLCPPNNAAGQAVKCGCRTSHVGGCLDDPPGLVPLRVPHAPRIGEVEDGHRALGSWAIRGREREDLDRDPRTAAELSQPGHLPAHDLMAA